MLKGAKKKDTQINTSPQNFAPKNTLSTWIKDKDKLFAAKEKGNKKKR